MMKRISLIIALFVILNSTIVTAQQYFAIGEIHVSPDGNYVAGVGNRALRVWDANTGDLLFGSSSDIFYADVSWNPESSRIVTASDDLLVRVWNVTDPAYDLGAIIAEFNPFEGSPRFLTAVEWSPNGEHFAIGGEFQVSIAIWDANNLNFVDTISGGFSAGEIEWSPNDNLIALTWYRDDAPAYAIPTLSNPATSAYVLCEDCPQENASAIAWNSDGSRLAIGYDGGTVHIVDISTNTSLVNFQSGVFVNSLSWSYDDQLIATALGIYDADTGILLESLVASPLLTYSVDFHPNSYELVYFNNETENLVFDDVSDLVPSPQAECM